MDYSKRNAWMVWAMAGGLAAGVGGCTNKSFMDPSIDRSSSWNPTPVSMPILTRLAAIEDESGELVEYSDPVPGDLIPQPMQYRLGPGDSVRVTMWDLIQKNQPEEHEVEIDSRGMVELPQVGRLYLSGKTTEEATEVVKESMQRLLANPLASVVAVAQRQQTYTLVGGVDRPGPYFVQRANYRLLEALTVGGKFDESAEEIYVIRQVPLTDESMGAPTPPAGPGPAGPAATPPRDARPILDIIDELAPPRNDRPQPGAFSSRQPESTPPRAPVVNLPEDTPGAEKTTTGASRGAETRWVFVNGRWTQVTMPASATAGADGAPPATENMVTQRVIRIPVKDLIAGKQSVNIVVRPGDVIRVPSPPVGTVVIGGQVARPGVYGIPTTGGLTLMSAIRGAAGGYSSIAIPERIDLTRRIGKDREATIMLDGAAIAHREQPDIFLKPNDQVIVGTNFWALPLAIIRNGFRSSYGFGFVLDRNLSNDLLGPEAIRQVTQ